jgi:UDP-N-acetylmuramyl pentapeptide synthase
MPAGDIVMGGKKEIAEKLGQYLRPGDWVLVKGSRSMGMEEIVEYLKK